MLCCGPQASPGGGVSGCRASAGHVGFRGCPPPQGSGARAQLLGLTGLVAGSTWGLPGSGIEPVSPVLAGGFLTTEPTGKPPFAPWKLVV